MINRCRACRRPREEHSTVVTERRWNPATGTPFDALRVIPPERLRVGSPPPPPACPEFEPIFHVEGVL